MKPVKRILTMAVIGVSSVLAFNVGSSLVKDVQFARAEEKVEMARGQLETLQDLSSAFKKVNRALENSVVQVRVEKKGNAMVGQLPRFDDDMLRRFFDRDGDGEPDQPEPDFSQQATGSGVIMDFANGEGFIVTNNHVVADAAKVSVVLNDGRQIEDATVVGTDPKTDVAVIKIKAERLIPAKWGDSDTLEKGDLIVAFGSPFGYVGSMSHGIVSALNRQAGVISSQYAYENFIQVDAPINPGNSGGPLVDLKGNVVGINTAIATRSGSFSGIGFAIPSNQAKSVYESLRANGKVVRGYLGVQIADVTNAAPEIKSDLETLGFKGDNGVLVRQVMRSGPAFQKLQPGDIITQIDGKSVKSMTELRNRIAMTKPGEEVKLTVWRDHKTETVGVKLEEQPEDQTRVASAPDAPSQAEIGVAIVTPNASDLKAAGLSEEATGALVRQVMPRSPAFRAGIRPGDLITRIGDSPIKSADDAKAALKDADLTKGVRIDILNREGEKMLTLRRPSR